MGKTSKRAHAANARAQRDASIVVIKRKFQADIASLRAQRDSGIEDAKLACAAAIKLGPQQPATALKPPVMTFVDAVLTAANNVPDAGRWHGDRVFLQSLYDEMRALGYTSSDRASFYRLLASAHRRGELRLTRADMVRAMPAALVASSELNDHGSQYHFLALD